MHSDKEPKLNCEQCSDNKITLSVKNNQIIGNFCSSCFSSCPECNDDGYLIYRNENNGLAYSRICDCSKIRNKISLINSAKIPGIYFSATINNFRQVHEIPQLENALIKARKFLNDFKQNLSSLNQNNAEEVDLSYKKGLLFHGSPGTGKTRLLSVILLDLIMESNQKVRFVEFSRLLSDIKSSWDRGAPERDLMNPLIEIDVLGIDELGKGRKSEWSLGVVDEIICGRYNSGKLTLFTTNFNPPGYPKSSEYSENIVERLDARTYSRLREMADFVDMNFRDFRLPETEWKKHSDNEKKASKSNIEIQTS